MVTVTVMVMEGEGGESGRTSKNPFLKAVRSFFPIFVGEH